MGLKKMFGSSNEGSNDNGRVTLPADSALLQPAFQPGRHYGFFPVAFGIFLIGPGEDEKTTKLSLGVEEQGMVRPVCAITTHKSIKLQISLHSGPTHTSPLMARGGLKAALRSSFFISMPCYVPGPNGPENKIEQMVQGKEVKYDTATYSVPVYNNGVESVEAFEWRSSNVYNASPQRPLEYRLTRSANGELVALYVADPAAETTGKFGSFQFAGSGASGQLGPYWTLMTVMTIIRLVQAKVEADMAVDKMLTASGKLARAGVIMVT